MPLVNGKKAFGRPNATSPIRLSLAYRAFSYPAVLRTPYDLQPMLSPLMARRPENSGASQ